MSDENVHLEEWKAALENARSFNTLLLQLRGFGIPIVITIMGGGVAFASKIDIPTIPVKGASIILIIVAFILLVVMYALYVAAKTTDTEKKCQTLKDKKDPGGDPEAKPKRDTKLTSLEIFEGAILCLVPILGLGIGWCFYRADFFGNSFAVSSPGVMGTILFALSLLLGLYGIDRCYYYKLLIGAVDQAEVLEEKLGFSLTCTISKMTPLNHSKNFITTMYWLPALGALMAVVILGYLKLWTGHNEAMSGGVTRCLQELLK